MREFFFGEWWARGNDLFDIATDALQRDLT